MAEITEITEIKIERKQRSIVPWILGLVLLLLVLWALVRTMDRNAASPADRGPAAAAAERLRDNTPPHLRQYA